MCIAEENFSNASTQITTWKNAPYYTQTFSVWNARGVITQPLNLCWLCNMCRITHTRRPDSQRPHRTKCLSLNNKSKWNHGKNRHFLHLVCFWHCQDQFQPTGNGKQWQPTTLPPICLQHSQLLRGETVLRYDCYVFPLIEILNST